MKIFLHHKPDSYINDCCVVKPISTTWNDFGFKSRVRLELTIANIKVILQAYYTAYLHNEFVTLGSISPNNLDDNIPQYILLESVTEYETLKNRFPNQFNYILKELNDISFLRMQRNRYKNFNLLLQSEVFNKSFIRSNESFLAYLYGYTGLGSTLTLNSEKIVAKNPLINEEIIFKINNHNTEVNFLPFRHFILIGRNGSGKSQTLRKIALKYTSNNLFNAVICFSQFDKSNSFSNRIRNITHINLTKSKKNIEILHSMIRIRFEQYRFEDNNFDIFIDLIRNINFMKKLVLYKDKNTFLSLNELVEFNSGEQNTLEKLQEITTYNKFKIKEGLNFYDLSSGENFFINLIFNLLNITNQYKNNILFLFDEPESFLHPNFISIFSEIICYFTNRLYCTAITATHSIYLVKNSLQDNIAIFRKNDEKIEFEKPSFNTFGANLNSLSYFIFGFESPLEHEESAIKKIVELESNNKTSFLELIDKYGQFLSSETIDRIYMKLQNEKN